MSDMQEISHFVILVLLSLSKTPVCNTNFYQLIRLAKLRFAMNSVGSIKEYELTASLTLRTIS
jgi:hypothetical protein